jgi:hypothetical protein
MGHPQLNAPQGLSGGDASGKFMVERERELPSCFIIHIERAGDDCRCACS